MLEIHKHMVLNENQKPIAVQIPIEDFERLEEIIENGGIHLTQVGPISGECSPKSVAFEAISYQPRRPLAMKVAHTPHYWSQLNTPYRKLWIGKIDG